MFYTYRLMHGLPDGNLCKIGTYWRRNVLIIKLHADIVHLVGYNKRVYS